MNKRSQACLRCALTKNLHQSHYYHLQMELGFGSTALAIASAVGPGSIAAKEVFASAHKETGNTAKVVADPRFVLANSPRR